MNKIFLLDSDAVIALTNPDHVHHRRVRTWFGAGLAFATCPITQGALVRYYLRHAPGATIALAKQVLGGITRHPDHVFWPDDAGYAEIPEKGVHGYRQVTDAYLVALAAKHGGVLATLDEALAAVHPGVLLVTPHS